jgi:hypothetical protein
MDKYLLLTLFLFGPTIASAQSYEKNNLPCIPELCLGDSLAELGKLKWDRAKSPFSLTSGKPDYVGSRPLSSYELAEAKRVYRGDVNKAAPYLSTGAFDQTTIPLLAAVTAACQKQELQGAFTSPSGNPTIVKISLLPDRGDAAIQRWTVTSISRQGGGIRGSTGGHTQAAR